MISQALAQFVTNCRYADLPELVRDAAKQCVLDWMGSAIRGSVEPPARMFADVARAQGGSAQATSLAGGFKTSSMWAAQINAAASHTVEMDDLHPTSVLHPAAPIISAAIAAGEAVNASGKELIRSIVAGYEVGIRAGEAAGRTHYQIWHTTGTCGTFGAAAAASVLLQLTEEQIVQALGSAGTQAAGLWQFLEDGAMSKQLHPAHAAGAGILSTELARRGFTGARRIFEGPKGFLAGLSKDAVADMLTAGLGQSYRIMTNSFKKHASCRHTHAAIDAALILRDEHHIGIDELSGVEARIYPAGFDLLHGVQPTTPYAAKFCLPYTVAAALCRGRVSLAEFDDLDAPDIRTAMGCVSMIRDESLGSEYPVKWPARITATLKSGKSVSAYVEYPRGDSQNPLTQLEIEEKFRQLTKGIVAAAEQDRIINVIANLENHTTGALFTT